MRTWVEVMVMVSWYGESMRRTSVPASGTDISPLTISGRVSSREKRTSLKAIVAGAGLARLFSRLPRSASAVSAGNGASRATSISRRIVGIPEVIEVEPVVRRTMRIVP